MKIPAAYLPHEIFAPADRGGLPVPRVFIAPQRYVQGRGVLSGLGRYVSLMRAKRIALLMSERGSRNEGLRIVESLRASGIESLVRSFRGECSLEEISAHAEALASERIECVIAAGGGKCIDAGKGIAFRLGTPVVIVPTLASNDAPCSALSVLYSPQGVSTGVEFYPQSPAFVVVDTDLIAAAPERYLVAGMGDAMATWYEARVCSRNPAAITAVGAAVAAKRVDESLEAVVEANTLLSGLGFESGGLAGAHGVAQSYTGIPGVNARYLHGEMVAMGTLAQLMMESRPDEAAMVAEFFATVGLPIHLGQLSLDADDKNALDVVVEGTLAFPFIGNMPQPLSADRVRASVLDAHRLGSVVSEKKGDAAYRRLHGLH